MPIKTPTAQTSTNETIKTNQFHGQYIYANGKRKSAVARVRLYPEGNGEIMINNKPMHNYCTFYTEVERILSPLKLTGHMKAFNINIKIEGGGHSAQAEAIRHGISKALILFDASLRTVLKKNKFLRRDSRIKERKKYGLKRARRAEQFSKR